MRASRRRRADTCSPSIRTAASSPTSRQFSRPGWIPGPTSGRLPGGCCARRGRNFARATSSTRRASCSPGRAATSTAARESPPRAATTMRRRLRERRVRPVSIAARRSWTRGSRPAISTRTFFSIARTPIWPGACAIWAGNPSTCRAPSRRTGAATFPNAGARCRRSSTTTPSRTASFCGSTTSRSASSPRRSFRPSRETWSSSAHASPWSARPCPRSAGCGATGPGCGPNAARSGTSASAGRPVASG